METRNHSPPDAEAAAATQLADLGARVRAWRSRRGMTRKALAVDSGVSLRFLADIETGRGNPSYLSLEAIARALNVTTAELLANAPSAALTRAVKVLEDLSDDKLLQAHTLLRVQFAVPDRPGRRNRIAMIGLRGAGKSTLGARLAQERGVPFIELDRQIEQESGISIKDLLLLHGQPAYRRQELRALMGLAQRWHDGVVIATGGSIVSERETFETLQQHFFCVWVKTSPEEHMARVIAQGDMRPFAGATPEEGTSQRLGDALADIRRILASRESLYACADAVVDTAARTVLQSYKDLQRACT